MGGKGFIDSALSHSTARCNDWRGDYAVVHQQCRGWAAFPSGMSGKQAANERIGREDVSDQLRLQPKAAAKDETAG